MLERASDELNLAHYRVLSAIGSGDERASRVAARLALGKPTVSAAVSSLCERGLLTRIDIESDRRAAALSLTAAGQALLGRVEHEMVDRLEELCARAPDGGRLLDALGWLGSAIDEKQAQGGHLRGAAPGGGR